MAVYNDAQLSSYVDQVFERLRAIEGQFALLSERAGLPYERPGAGAPLEVVELAAAGERMGTIRKYCERTSAGAGEASKAVEGL